MRFRPLHRRIALARAPDLMAKRAPGLLVRFGGHAMAAGVTLRSGNFERFCQTFAEVAGELIAPADLDRTLTTDGGLESGYFSLDIARLLEREIWGQGFPAPLFVDEFEVEEKVGLFAGLMNNISSLFKAGLRTA